MTESVMASPTNDRRTRDELLREIARLHEQNRNGEHAIHELMVHQEELQVQHEQLLQSQRDLEMARDRFAELFDFAPIGYVVLDSGGVIREANLAAAVL